MKTLAALVIILLMPFSVLRAQFVEHTQVYGQVQTDINLGNKIRLLPDSNFIIAGQWNNQAYLMKVDCEGNPLSTQFYGSLIGGNSAFLDIQRLPDGNWVAVGQCDHCQPYPDTTMKSILLKVDANLVPDTATGVTILGKSARYSQFPATTQKDPRLLIDGNTLVLVAEYGTIGSLNASDFILTKLNFNLDTLSTRLIHHQYFDNPAALFKNPAGYLVLANHAFVSGAALIQTDTQGNVLWTNLGVSDVVATAGTQLPNGNVLACGVQTNTGGWIAELSGATGLPTGNQLVQGGERATDLQLLPDSNVLMTAWFPLFTGARSTRIYRLKTNPLQTLGAFDEVPNPDIFTNMGSLSILPLSDDGSSFSTTGVRGFYNRTFFHTKRDCGLLTQPGQYATILCPGESINIGNSVFNEGHSSGTATLPMAAACGCDSIVQVTLTYLPPAASTYSPTLCPGDSVIVAGQVFNAGNPGGDVVFEGQAASGCDSVIHVSLAFFPPAVSTFSPGLCRGGSLTIGGQLFDAAHSNGDVVFTGQSANGCDSTVHVSLHFFPAAESTLSPALCPGGSLTISGQVFDAAHPNGDVVFTGQSANGCDSTVHVSLHFSPAAESTLSPALCPGGSLTISGQVFDAAHPNGDVVFTGQSANGCDSTVHVTLHFYPPATGFLSDTLMVGDSLVVNGTVFNAAHPAGSVVLPNASYTGCDSTVVIDLKFVSGIKNSLSDSPNWRLLPNPAIAGSILHLYGQIPAGAGLTVRCFNLSGNLVWEKTEVMLQPKNALSLPAPLTAGAYWLTVQDPEGRRGVIRLIVF